jgi:serpin B
MKTKTHFLYTFFFLAMAMSACQPSSDTDPDLPDLSPLDPSVTFAVGESNDFSFQMWNEAASAKPSGENLFISPFSISMALSMAANGASEELREDFSALLGMGDVAETNLAYQLLMERLPKMDKKVSMDIANSVWHRQEMRVNMQAKENLRTYYNAEIKGADFSNPATVNSINNWVNQATKGKIPSIIDEIRQEHVMFLINALYFKADWTVPFKEENTVPRPFTRLDGRVVQVPMMMNTEAKYLYRSTEQFEVLDIPYGNKQYRMTVVIPANASSFEGFLSGWSPALLREQLNLAREVGYDLYFPKLKMETELELGQLLQAMGLSAAFTTSKGGFPNFFDEDGEFILTDVKHKAFLEVDEKGTEAAAVTSIGVGVTSLPPSVWVNKPFYFFIREQHTDAILFMGRCMDPNQ